jgi:hypothetical protein
MTKEKIDALVAKYPIVYWMQYPLVELEDKHYDNLEWLSCKLQELNYRFSNLNLLAQITDVKTRQGRIYVLLRANQYVKIACFRGWRSKAIANAMAWLSKRGYDLENYKGWARPGFYLQAVELINEFQRRCRYGLH